MKAEQAAERSNPQTPFGAQLVLHQAGRGGKKHVGSDGADDDGIDVGGSQAALGERFLGGFDREVAGGHAFFDDVALADADAGENPFIVGVDHFLEVGVGEKTGRHVGAKGADLNSFCRADRVCLGSFN